VLLINRSPADVVVRVDGHRGLVALDPYDVALVRTGRRDR